MHEELVAIVETLRSGNHPGLDAMLVAGILEEERASLDARPGVLDRIERLIDDSLREGAED